MNSLWDIRIFLGLVPEESPCMSTWEDRKNFSSVFCHTLRLDIGYCVVFVVSQCFENWVSAPLGPKRVCVIEEASLHRWILFWHDKNKLLFLASTCVAQ